MEIMATWVGEVESEFFNRWLVVGVPWGAAVGVTGAACALHHSGSYRGGVTGCAGTERCSVKVHYSSHIPNLRPPHSTSHTASGSHTRRAFPLSDCVPALIRRHLPLSPLPRLISLALCAPPEHDFNSDSINPRCDFVLCPSTQWPNTEGVKYCPVFFLNQWKQEKMSRQWIVG